MTRLAILAALALAACAAPAPPDDTAARMAALTAQTDRVDLAITKLERDRGCRWGVTYINGRLLHLCVTHSETYWEPRPLGGAGP